MNATEALALSEQHAQPDIDRVMAGIKAACLVGKVTYEPKTELLDTTLHHLKNEGFELLGPPYDRTRLVVAWNKQAQNEPANAPYGRLNGLRAERAASFGQMMKLGFWIGAFIMLALLVLLAVGVFK